MKNFFSITVAFIKNEYFEEWLNNKKSNKSMETWLQICEIGCTSNKKILIAGLHVAKEEILNDLQNTKEYNNKNFIIFGDFNLDF